VGIQTFHLESSLAQRTPVSASLVAGSGPARQRAAVVMSLVQSVQQMNTIHRYPAGISATVDVHEFAPLKDVLQRS